MKSYFYETKPDEYLTKAEVKSIVKKLRVLRAKYEGDVEMWSPNPYNISLIHKECINENERLKFFSYFNKLKEKVLVDVLNEKIVLDGTVSATGKLKFTGVFVRTEKWNRFVLEALKIMVEESNNKIRWMVI